MSNSNYTRPTKSLAILSGFVVLFVFITTLTICFKIAQEFGQARAVASAKPCCCIEESHK